MQSSTKLDPVWLSTIIRLRKSLRRYFWRIIDTLWLDWCCVTNMDTAKIVIAFVNFTSCERIQIGDLHIPYTYLQQRRLGVCIKIHAHVLLLLAVHKHSHTPTTGSRAKSEHYLRVAKNNQRTESHPPHCSHHFHQSVGCMFPNSLVNSCASPWSVASQRIGP